VALGATAIEALPMKDLDNILLPVGTGFLAAELLL
jgi:dolichol kinase